MTDSQFLPKPLIAFVLVCLGLGTPGIPHEARSQEVAIRLNNGSEISAVVERLDSESLVFRAAGSQASARLTYDQIDFVDWPEPDAWTRAMQWYDLGRFAEAAAIFEQVAAEANRSRFYYPVPGNYSTRAHRRLLDCHRRMGDAEAVARELEKFEPDRMPKAEREVPPALLVWAAAGEEDWTRVTQLTSRFESEVSPGSEQGTEIAYLSGLAHEQQGAVREAVVAYGQAYSLNAATDPRLSRLALERSINLVAIEWERREAERDTRREEQEEFVSLRAQVHLYAILFGRGELWEGATPMAVAALKEGFDQGEAALGQSGRTKVSGDLSAETEGAEMVEQVTADHMKEVKVKKEEAKEAASPEKSGPETDRQ